MCATGLAVMAYYYFDFRDIKKLDRYDLLSSFPNFWFWQNLDSCYGVLSQLYLGSASGTRKPTTSSLTKCTKDMVSLPGQGPIYSLVDALDDIIVYIKSVVHSGRKTRRWRTRKRNWLFRCFLRKRTACKLYSSP